MVCLLSDLRAINSLVYNQDHWTIFWIDTVNRHPRLTANTWDSTGDRQIAGEWSKHTPRIRKPTGQVIPFLSYQIVTRTWAWVWFALKFGWDAISVRAGDWDAKATFSTLLLQHGGELVHQPWWYSGAMTSWALRQWQTAWVKCSARNWLHSHIKGSRVWSSWPVVWARSWLTGAYRWFLTLASNSFEACFLRCEVGVISPVCDIVSTHKFNIWLNGLLRNTHPLRGIFTLHWIGIKWLHWHTWVIAVTETWVGCWPPAPLTEREDDLEFFQRRLTRNNSWWFDTDRRRI